MCCRLRKGLWRDDQSWLLGGGCQICDAVVAAAKEICNKGLLSDVRMAAMGFCSHYLSRLGGVEVHVTAIRGTGDREYSGMKLGIENPKFFGLNPNRTQGQKKRVPMWIRYDKLASGSGMETVEPEP